MKGIESRGIKRTPEDFQNNIINYEPYIMGEFECKVCGSIIPIKIPKLFTHSFDVMCAICFSRWEISSKE